MVGQNCALYGCSTSRTHEGCSLFKIPVVGAADREETTALKKTAREEWLRLLLRTRQVTADLKKQKWYLYLALVRSHLSYGSEIWAPQGFQSVQRRASKFILQDYELPYPECLKKLNLLPISYWLELKDLIFFFKCKHGLFDLDISSFVTFSSNSSSHTRSSSDNLLHVNHCRTSLFRNSFFNRIVFLWNNLSPTIRNSSSVSSFKIFSTSFIF